MPSGFPPSQLDNAQVLPAVYNGQGQLRVEAEVSVNIAAAQEVIISSADDSIKIGDASGNYATITTVRPHKAIDVNTALGFSNVTPTYPKQVSISSSSITILASNPNRVYAHISNNSDSSVYIQYAIDAAVGQGIRLFPNSLYSISGSELWTGNITAVSNSGPVLIDVMEAVY